MDTYVLRTRDKVLVKTGALIWYVNYFGQIVPTIFKQKGKGTVAYFSLHKNAEEFAKRILAIDSVYERGKIIRNESL